MGQDWHEVGQMALEFITRRARSGVTAGSDRTPRERAYLQRCTHLHWRTGTLIMFTHDIGHHTSGWMKNPDYERCRHLSLSFRAPVPTQPPDFLGSPHRIKQLGGYIELRPFDHALAAEWVKLIHGEDRKYAWSEGPFSPQGKELGVFHYRVFCDAGWNAIKPRGEVYSRELTEYGWRSWSEVQGPDAAPNWVDAS